MKEIKDNIWGLKSARTPICVTTNGFVKNNGACVMGAGIAYQARERYPRLQFELGEAITKYGNRVIYFENYDIITFPTKHTWSQPSSLDLIKRSAEELVALSEKYEKIDNIYLPRPGCANGGRDWIDEVKPILEPIFTNDSKIIICDWRS